MHALKRMKSVEDNFCRPCDAFFKTRSKLDIHKNFYHKSENPTAYIYPRNHEQKQNEMIDNLMPPDFYFEVEDENGPETLIVEDVRQYCRFLEKLAIFGTWIMNRLPFIRSRLTTNILKRLITGFYRVSHSKEDKGEPREDRLEWPRLWGITMIY